MKKFQILGTVLLLSVVTTLLVACQKEQDGITNEVNNTTEESITAVEVDASSIPGIIDQNEAAKLAARYAAARVNKSTAVSFSVRDIQNYLNVLKRDRSEKIYVNFGMYENGRMTVFFSGDKKKRSGNVRNDNEKETEFLNHGGLLP